MRADRAFGQKATREWDAPWFSKCKELVARAVEDVIAAWGPGLWTKLAAVEIQIQFIGEEPFFAWYNENRQTIAFNAALIQDRESESFGSYPYYVFLHEYGHHLLALLGQENAALRKALEVCWTRSQSNPADFSLIPGVKLGKSEYFATCHMFYFGNPERLRSKAPEVYDALHGLDRRLRDGKQQV